MIRLKQNKIKTALLLACLFVFTFPVFSQNLEQARLDLEPYSSESLLIRQKVIQAELAGNKSLFDSLLPLMLNTDSVYLLKAVRYIDEYGWLGKSQIGSLANRSLFLIIQHGKPEILEKYFPALQASALAGESDKSSMALMEDRILISKNQKQKYGTQYYWDNDKKTKIFYPIEDVRNVNKRRRKINLGSIKKDAKESGIRFE